MKNLGWALMNPKVMNKVLGGTGLTSNKDETDQLADDKPKDNKPVETQDLHTLTVWVNVESGTNKRKKVLYHLPRGPVNCTLANDLQSKALWVMLSISQPVQSEPENRGTPYVQHTCAAFLTCSKRAALETGESDAASGAVVGAAGAAELLDELLAPAWALARSWLMRLRCGVGMLWSHLALEAKKFVSRGNRAGLHTLLSNLSRGMSETGLDLKSAWADFMAAGICSDSRVGGSDMCILPMTRLRGLGWVSPGAGGEGARAKVDGPVHVVACCHGADKHLL
jgi:hypothetical protein